MNVSKPGMVERESRPYVAITSSVPMGRLGTDLPPLIDEVSGWLAARNIPSVGAPFWKYNGIDMEGELEVEVGVPVATGVRGDERVRAGVLPAGRYATLHHIGHPDTLVDANAALLTWAGDQQRAAGSAGSTGAAARARSCAVCGPDSAGHHSSAIAAVPDADNDDHDADNDDHHADDGGTEGVAGGGVGDRRRGADAGGGGRANPDAQKGGTHP